MSETVKTTRVELRMDKDHPNNIRRFKAWVNSLPDDMDDGDICGAVGPLELEMKRVIAYRYKDGSGCGIVVNPMGTHLGERFYKRVEIISTFDRRWPGESAS